MLLSLILSLLLLSLSSIFSEALHHTDVGKSSVYERSLFYTTIRVLRKKVGGEGERKGEKKEDLKKKGGRGRNGEEGSLKKKREMGKGKLRRNEGT